ncbi:MAG: transporter substrate-binding domain-containing protein, partial [Pirellulaceae bacterium]|nr:transporter substrate-binding domain-containing protein [Pirellulaceae bacterium]
AKAVLTIPLLLDIAELPSDIFDLWLASGVIAARFGDLMKTMHLIAFSILTIACLNRGLRMQPIKILLGLAMMLIVLLGTAFAIRSYLDVGFKDRYSREQLITEREIVFPKRFRHVGKTVMRVVEEGTPHPPVPGEYPSRVARIRAEGKIRVGFYPEQLPFSYFNNAGQLIGMDVQMAVFLANDLEVTLEMVPIRPDQLEDQLINNEFDVAMSAIEGTVMRAERFPAFAPYMFVTIAIVAPDHYAAEFKSIDTLLQVPDLKLACLKKGYFYDRLPRIFADRMDEETATNDRITLIPLDSVSDFFNGACEREHGEVHGLLINAEAGSAWTMRYPRFTVTNPLKGEVQIPLYYLTDDDELFADFLRNWFALRKADGAFQWVYDYWILGYELKKDTQRWSILKDVIGWNR